MALDDRQIKAIELLVEGTMKISDIAKVCDVSRQTIWDWRKNNDFRAELDRRLTAIKTEANEKINSNLVPVVNELIRLALSNDTPIREKKDCLQYLCNRALGSPTSSVNMEVDDKSSNDSTNPIEEFKAFIAKHVTTEKAE